MKKWAFAAAVSAFLLAACQTSTISSMGAAPSSGPPLWMQYVCNQVGPGHCAKMTVSGGTLSTDTPTMVFHTVDGRAFALWWIETEGYTFANAQGNRPIRFKTDSQGQIDPEDSKLCYHFFSNYIPDNRRVFVCMNRATVKGQFPYGITVTPNDGSAPITLDPMIVND